MIKRFSFDWQSRGQRFDPAYLHQKNSREACCYAGFTAVCFAVLLPFDVLVLTCFKLRCYGGCYGICLHNIKVV